MDEKWVTIFSTANLYDAELKKGLLIENGVEAVIMNKKDSSYLVGEAEILVRIDDIIRAKYIINESKSE